MILTVPYRDVSTIDCRLPMLVYLHHGMEIKNGLLRRSKRQGRPALQPCPQPCPNHRFETWPRQAWSERHLSAEPWIELRRSRSSSAASEGGRRVPKICERRTRGLSTSLLFPFFLEQDTMAPVQSDISRQLLQSARRAAVAVAPAIAQLAVRSAHARRGLKVDHTQGVTLGVIAAMIVVIALLWNLPYVRWSLWPFKVSSVVGTSSHLVAYKLYRCSQSLSTNSDTQSRLAALVAMSNPSRSTLVKGESRT